jgi:hypothetical protein
MKKAKLKSSTALPSEIVIPNACALRLCNGADIRGLPKSVDIWMYERGGNVQLFAPKGVVVKPVLKRIVLKDESGYGWDLKHVHQVFNGMTKVWPPEQKVRT